MGSSKQLEACWRRAGNTIAACVQIALTLFYAGAIVILILIYRQASFLQRITISPGMRMGNEYRLANSLVPLWYNLSMHIYLPGYGAAPLLAGGGEGEAVFTVTVLIKMLVKEATRQVELNAERLNITHRLEDILVSMDGGTARNGGATTMGEERRIQISVVGLEHQPKFGKLVLQLNSELHAGNDYRIKIPYTATIGKCFMGLCRGSYYGGQGGLEEHYFAVTHFEPIGARRFAPCFDEPSYKAVWRVDIHHPAGTIALSNAIEVYTSKSGDWMHTRFGETPPMSSYTLALAVSDFAYSQMNFISSFSGKNIRLRVWSRPAVLPYVEWSLSTAAKLLPFYEEMFQVEFPLPKLDLFAVPDFLHGAQENWGLITFHEVTLQGGLNHSVEILTHELVHQWFGNLVTMEWWSDTFLNEGFASYFEKHGSAFVTNQSISMPPAEEGLAQHEDMLSAAIPPHFEVETPGDYTAVFGYTSYGKAAFIIHELGRQIGEENLQAGMRKYLRKRKFSTANYHDMLDALSSVSPSLNKTIVIGKGKAAGNEEEVKLSVREFAESWITNAGYPLVYVRRLNSTAVELRQSRFTIDREEKEEGSSADFGQVHVKERWWIPIWYSVDGVDRAMEFLHNSLTLSVDETQLLLVNGNSNGLYRVYYDAQLRNQILDRLAQNTSGISYSPRRRFIDDLFWLARGNYISYRVVLDAIASLVQNGDFGAHDLKLLIALLLKDIAQLFGGGEPEAQNVEEYLNWLLSFDSSEERKYIAGSNPLSARFLLSRIEKEELNRPFLHHRKHPMLRPSHMHHVISRNRGNFFGVESRRGSMQNHHTTSPSLLKSDVRHAIEASGRLHSHWHSGKNAEIHDSGSGDGHHQMVVLDTTPSFAQNGDFDGQWQSGYRLFAGTWPISNEDPVLGKGVDIDVSNFHDLFYVPCIVEQPDGAMSSECSRVQRPQREKTYCVGVRYGTRRAFNLVRTLYAREKKSYGERNDLLHALSCVREEALLKRLLNAITYDNEPSFLSILHADFVELYSNIAEENELGAKLIMPFFRANFQHIVERCKADIFAHSLNRIIEATFRDNSHEGIHMLERFVEQHASVTRLYRGFANQLAKLRAERKWLDRNFALLNTWFVEQNEAHRRQGHRRQQPAITRQAMRIR